jgi:hypothetical protein
MGVGRLSWRRLELILLSVQMRDLRDRLKPTGVDPENVSDFYHTLGLPETD